MAGKRKFPDAGDPSDAKGFLALREKLLEALGIANYSPRTVETMSARLRAFILWCDERGLTHPEDVTRAHMERFQAWLFHYRKDDGNPLDFGTQQLHIGAIKLFFKWLVKAGHISFSPAADLEYPKKGDKLPKAVLSHAEVEQVMAAADPATVLGLRDRAVVEVLYSTGVRRMELEGVRLEDLNVSSGTLFVRKAKGDKQRVVPLGERALAWVRKYLDDARPNLVTDETERALFLDKDGRALSKRAISALGKKLLRRANLGKAGSVHVFRHSAATAMLEGGRAVRSGTAGALVAGLDAGLHAGRHLEAAGGPRGDAPGGASWEAARAGRGAGARAAARGRGRGGGGCGPSPESLEWTVR